MAATTTVRVHRRKSPAAARRSETVAEARKRASAWMTVAATRLKEALPVREGRGTKAAPTVASSADGAETSKGPLAASGPSPAPLAAARKAVGAVRDVLTSTPATAPARRDRSRVLPATSEPLSPNGGAVRADAVIATRARRGTYPLAAPSWHAFRGYVTDRSDWDELRSVGLPAMMRAHRALALAVAAAGAALVLTLVALATYFCLAPATASANSPYEAAETAAPMSTPASQWKAGEIPSLYQADAAWGGTPYGQATLGEAGAAPTGFAMAYVAVTGDTAKTPADFAQWATDHDLTAAGADTVQTFLAEAACEFGLSLKLIEVDDHALRRAIVSNIPVIVVTEPGTFAPVASLIVLDDIDGNSRIVLHDPASAARTAKSWSFNDITGAALAAYEVSAA